MSDAYADLTQSMNRYATRQPATSPVIFHFLDGNHADEKPREVAFSEAVFNEARKHGRVLYVVEEASAKEMKALFDEYKSANTSTQRREEIESGLHRMANNYNADPTRSETYANALISVARRYREGKAEVLFPDPRGEKLKEMNLSSEEWQKITDAIRSNSAANPIEAGQSLQRKQCEIKNTAKRYALTDGLTKIGIVASDSANGISTHITDATIASSIISAATDIKKATSEKVVVISLYGILHDLNEHLAGQTIAVTRQNFAAMYKGAYDIPTSKNTRKQTPSDWFQADTGSFFQLDSDSKRAEMFGMDAEGFRRWQSTPPAKREESPPLTLEQRLEKARQEFDATCKDRPTISPVVPNDKPKQLPLKKAATDDIHVVT